MPKTTTPETCPNCARRGTLKADYVLFDTFERASTATWQCIYCGAVCEQHGAHGRLIATSIKQITLAPGELAELRTVLTTPKPTESKAK